MSETRLSKFISLVLRHDPGRIGLVLDPQGWADVEDLIARAKVAGVALDRSDVERIVRESDKQRFALSPDGARIRANQGHSVDIDLALEPEAPPAELFHGTADRNLLSIRATGLHAIARQHVHLSPDRATAVKVGARHGRPVVLVVHAGRMAAAGHVFYRSANGVWLTQRVPPGFIIFPVSDLDA